MLSIELFDVVICGQKILWSKDSISGRMIRTKERVQLLNALAGNIQKLFSYTKFFLANRKRGKLFYQSVAS